MGDALGSTMRPLMVTVGAWMITAESLRMRIEVLLISTTFNEPPPRACCIRM